VRAATGSRHRDKPRAERPRAHSSAPSDTIRRRVLHVIDREGTTSTAASHVFEVGVVTLILLNVLAVILASFGDIYARFRQLFDAFELVSVIIFTLEYGLRLWTAGLKYPDLKPVPAVLRYVFSFGAIIDLAAILPFYLPLAVPIDLRFLRILRISRVLRVFKLQRHSDSLQLVGRVFRLRSKELLVTIFVTIMLLVVAASAMYHLENGAQPDKFPNIVASLWWAVATLTTVGYGDVFPVTGGGKLLAGVIAILGIGLVALPAGIISSGFMEEIKKRKARKKRRAMTCPHCGKRIRIAE
jgi:voltage-gated potassium channel